MPIDTSVLSTVSETDRVIFRRFCNRSKVDTDELKNLPNKIPGGGGGGAPRAAVPSSPTPSSPRRDNDDDAPPPPSLFAKRVQHHSLPSPPGSPTASPPKMVRASAETRNLPLPPMPPPPPLPPLPPAHQTYLTAGVAPMPPPLPTWHNNQATHQTATRITAAPSGLDAEERHRRQSGLLQLQKLEIDLGVKLSREFSMEDSSEDIEFEIDFHENNASVRRGVSFMKLGLGAGMYGLEKLNDKVGPIADLTGLAGTTISSMDMYGAPMEKLYRKYWRKRMSNPMSELIFLIVATIAATHIGNKGGPLMKGMTKMFLGMMNKGGGGGGGGNGNNGTPDLKGSILGSLFGGAGGAAGGNNPLGDLVGSLLNGQKGMAPGFPSRVNVNTSNPPPPPPPPPAPAPAPAAPPQHHHHHNYFAAPPVAPPATTASSAPPVQPPPQPSSATMATPLRPPSTSSFFHNNNTNNTTKPAPAAPSHPIEGMFIFPLAGTPVLSSATRRGNPDTFLSLPTVEEITEEDDEKTQQPPPSTPATVINHRLFEDMINQAKAQSAEVGEPASSA